jgi:hypothetical protein
MNESGDSMKLYVEASSKKSLIQRLAAGEEISGYNYSMFGGGGRYMLDDNLADGTIIAIYSKMVQGNPVAKSWGTWTNGVLKAETFEAERGERMNNSRPCRCNVCDKYIRKGDEMYDNEGYDLYCRTCYKEYYLWEVLGHGAESFSAEDDMIICEGCNMERYSDVDFTIDNAREDVLDDGDVLCDYCWASHDKYVENAEMTVDELNEMVKNLGPKAYFEFCYRFDIDSEDAQEMSWFIADHYDSPKIVSWLMENHDKFDAETFEAPYAFNDDRCDNCERSVIDEPDMIRIPIYIDDSEYDVCEVCYDKLIDTSNDFGQTYVSFEATNGWKVTCSKCGVQGHNKSTCGKTPKTYVRKTIKKDDAMFTTMMDQWHTGIRYTQRTGYIMGLTGVIVGWFINNQFFCRK